MVLYRILDGDDVYVRRINLAQEGVEGSGFSGTGRTGDQDQAVGFLYFFFYNFKQVWFDSEPFEVYLNSLRIKYAHHDRLPVGTRDHRVSDAYFFFALHYIETSVLGDLG